MVVEHKALLNSEATFVVYLIDGQDQLLRINRERLQAYLEDNWVKGESRPWKVLRGGEYRDYMTLMPVKEFVQMCKPINNVKKQARPFPESSLVKPPIHLRK